MYNVQDGSGLYYVAKPGKTVAAVVAPEKFLFRFMDGLPKTKGLFTLNGRIDIPVGPNSYMEIDLLCKEKNVAVEIDGAFHFEDAEHYRRDRRKDFLLQQNGYLCSPLPRRGA